MRTKEERERDRRDRFGSPMLNRMSKAQMRKDSANAIPWTGGFKRKDDDDRTESSKEFAKKWGAR